MDSEQDISVELKSLHIHRERISSLPEEFPTFDRTLMIRNKEVTRSNVRTGLKESSQ